MRSVHPKGLYVYVYVSSPLLVVVTHTVSVSARIRHYRNTNATKSEVGGGGSLGVWGTGYRNKTWMLGTNMTSEGGRYRGVFVWNHDKATNKKVKWMLWEGVIRLQMARTCQCTQREIIR